jgi:hypothetical protein
MGMLGNTGMDLGVKSSGRCSTSATLQSPHSKYPSRYSLPHSGQNISLPPMTANGDADERRAGREAAGSVRSIGRVRHQCLIAVLYAHAPPSLIAWENATPAPPRREVPRGGQAAVWGRSAAEAPSCPGRETRWRSQQQRAKPVAASQFGAPQAGERPVDGLGSGGYT